MTEMLRAIGEAEPYRPFTNDERARLAPYFSNLDGHVFALTNLPETVKGALFARYSRSGKSLRRLFLDEFADKVTPESSAPVERSAPVARAELYARCSATTATTRWRSWAAPTSPVNTSRTSSQRCSSGDG